jgi:hypothetical protein
MKTRSRISVFALSSLLFALCASRAHAQSFLQSTNYAVTTNAATRTITITNYPGSEYTREWYPHAIQLANYSANTGVLLKVEHIRQGGSVPRIGTNVTIVITNQLFWSDSTAALTSTNWIAPARWYVRPYTDSLRISTDCQTGTVSISREVLP